MRNAPCKCQFPLLTQIQFALVARRVARLRWRNSTRRQSWVPPKVNGSSGSDSFNQAVERKELNLPAIVLADEGWARIGGDDHKVGFGVRASEDQQAGRVEIASRPFAFDGQWGLASRQPNEIHLVGLPGFLEEKLKR